MLKAEEAKIYLSTHDSYEEQYESLDLKISVALPLVRYVDW